MLFRSLPPANGEGVRVDTGVFEGGEVSMFYDPMIAKLITYGTDRKEATQRMVEALDAYYIRGVNHNISFLNALMVHPRFVAGKLTTNFIAEEYPEGFSPDLVPQEDPALCVVAAAVINKKFRCRNSFHHPVGYCSQAVFHFHGLNNSHFLTGLHLIT